MRFPHQGDPASLCSARLLRAPRSLGPATRSPATTGVPPQRDCAGVCHTTVVALEVASDVAAYGLFQIAFTSLDTRVSRCLVKLCRCQNAALAFSAFRRIPFSHRLQLIRKAIKPVASDASFSEEVRELQSGLDLADGVRKWRNERIHAEVRFTGEGQPVIVDETGRPLHFDIDACERKIREAIRAAIVIEAAVPHLVAYEKDLQELMDE